MDVNTYIKIHELIDAKRNEMIEKLCEFCNLQGATDWQIREKTYLFLDNIEKLDKYLSLLKKTFDGQ